jgi:hypothetical protein
LAWEIFSNAPAALQTLHGVLETQEWAAMRGARNLLPSWMAKAVSEASGG